MLKASFRLVSVYCDSKRVFIDLCFIFWISLRTFASIYGYLYFLGVSCTFGVVLLMIQLRYHSALQDLWQGNQAWLSFLFSHLLVIDACMLVKMLLGNIVSYRFCSQSFRSLICLQFTSYIITKILSDQCLIFLQFKLSLGHWLWKKKHIFYLVLSAWRPHAWGAKRTGKHPPPKAGAAGRHSGNNELLWIIYSTRTHYSKVSHALLYYNSCMDLTGLFI